jgi:predicted Rossmann fold nucleotide-binding protein DprA/Smf involved in DNA uptake
MLSALDDGYPAALQNCFRSTAPPILRVVGNLDLLAQRGIDQESMTAALDVGGSAVGALADSLARQVTKPQFHRAILERRIASAFPTSLPLAFSSPMRGAGIGSSMR